MRQILITVILLLATSFTIFAQSQNEYEVITVENADRLVEIMSWDRDLPSSPYRAIFNPDGTELAIAFNSGQVEFISMETLETIRVIDGIETSTEWLTYSLDGEEFLLWNLEGVYTLVDIETGEKLAVNTTPFGDNWFSATPDVRKYIRYDYGEVGISVHDILTGQEILVFENVSYWSVSYDGKLLLTRNTDLIVQIWDVDTGEMIFEVPRPSHNIATDDLYGAGFTPDGLVWVNYPQYTETENGVIWDSPIQLWNMSTSELVLELDETNYVSDLTIDPTNSFIITKNFMTGGCLVWHLESLQKEGCRGFDGIFSPDGQLILNLRSSYNVEVRQFQCVCTPIATLDTEQTVFAEFSADGRFILTIDYDIHLWGVPSDE